MFINAGTCDTVCVSVVTPVPGKYLQTRGLRSATTGCRIYHDSYVKLFIYDSGTGDRSRSSDYLRAGRSGDRIPVGGGGARFSAPFHTGSWAYPSYYTVVTGSFPGVKRPGRGVDQQLPSSAEVKERVELYLNPPQGLRGLFQGDLCILQAEST
jgi:hypothetical protein